MSAHPTPVPLHLFSVSYWLVPGLVLKNMILQGFPSHDCLRPDIANSFDFMVDQVGAGGGGAGDGTFMLNNGRWDAEAFGGMLISYEVVSA